MISRSIDFSLSDTFLLLNEALPINLSRKLRLLPLLAPLLGLFLVLGEAEAEDEDAEWTSFDSDMISFVDERCSFPFTNQRGTRRVGLSWRWDLDEAKTNARMKARKNQQLL